MSFRDLGLSDELLKAVSDAGYTEPTPIQAGAIPSVLMGRDILGIAQTGTGKTAGFTLPMIDILDQGRARARMPRSLILEPTRELAAQVEESFEKYGKNHKLSKTLLIGGTNMAGQVKDLDRGVDVLIATPGRLLDHHQRGTVMLTGIDILVIDEADRMLDMGFIPDVEKICSLITKAHQTLFFSATMAPPIKRLVDKFLDNPKLVEVAKAATTAETITQRVVHVAPKLKREKLRELIRQEPVKNAIVFCNRKVDLKELYKSMKRHKFSVGELHGDMDQTSRMETLKAFKENDIQILVASDVAARGLDIPDVSHVFNFDIPSTAEDYVHRIGRTGRAGREGASFTLATKGKNDVKWLADIEKLIGQKITVAGKEAAKAPSKNTKDEKKPAKKTAPKKEDAKKVDAKKEEPRKPDAHRSEPKKAEPKKAVAKKPEPTKEQPKKSSPKQADPKKADANKDEPNKGAPKKAEPKKAEAKKPQAANPKPNARRNEGNQNRRGNRGRNMSADDVATMDDEQKVGLGKTIPAFLMPKS